MNGWACGRWLVVGLGLGLGLGMAGGLEAQAPAAAPAPAAGDGSAAPAADDAKVMSYIHGGWDTLSRSMSECKSVVDTKVTTAPVLYLPAGLATPPAVAAMQRQCTVAVERLPRKIAKMGDVAVGEIPKEGLLYLPNRYVVPGGRFNEMYGWDSYFIILGLVADGRTALAHGMVENFFYEIENYGALLNANRTYFLTRSQPPLLTSMVREVWGAPGGARDKAWLATAYGYATRDYGLWVSPVHRAGKTGLARYEDIGVGPVPEMADDNGYYPDVDPVDAGAPGGGSGVPGDGSGCADAGAGGGAGDDELQCAGVEGVRAGACGRAPADGGVLSGGPGDAGVGVRYDVPVRAVFGVDGPVCAGVSEQPAVQVRAGYGVLCRGAGEARGGEGVGGGGRLRGRLQ